MLLRHLCGPWASVQGVQALAVKLRSCPHYRRRTAVNGRARQLQAGGAAAQSQQACSCLRCRPASAPRSRMCCDAITENDPHTSCLVRQPTRGTQPRSTKKWTPPGPRPLPHKYKHNGSTEHIGRAHWREGAGKTQQKPESMFRFVPNVQEGREEVTQCLHRALIPSVCKGQEQSA